jgi:hypothetical protein
MVVAQAVTLGWSQEFFSNEATSTVLYNRTWSKTILLFSIITLAVLRFLVRVSGRNQKFYFMKISRQLKDKLKSQPRVHYQCPTTLGIQLTYRLHASLKKEYSLFCWDFEFQVTKNLPTCGLTTLFIWAHEWSLSSDSRCCLTKIYVSVYYIHERNDIHKFPSTLPFGVPVTQIVQKKMFNATSRIYWFNCQLMLQIVVTKKRYIYGLTFVGNYRYAMLKNS